MFTTLDLRKYGRSLVDNARMAPSLHNAQPWRFRVTFDAVEVYADRSRTVPVADPDGRQMLIGIGAAVYVLRLGVALLGARPRVTLLPDPARPDLAAVVSVGPQHLPTVAERRLMMQVSRRRTVREKMDPRVPGEVRERLLAFGSFEGCLLHWMSDTEPRGRLADLVTQAEHRQQADPRIRAELRRWVGGRTVRHGSGVPEEALGPSGEVGHQARFPLRDFAGGRPRLAPDTEPVEDEPSVAVLTSEGDWPVDWLRVGQALMRVLLAATADGFAASYLNQPLEVPDLRAKVRDELGLAGVPQMILRLGTPVDGWPLPTPRRPVDEILSS